MATANRVSNVQVEKYCSPRWLDQNLQPGALIVCDCEGFEGELLVRTGSPALGSAVLLVETHDEINPGVTDAICRRFAGSHHLAMVSTSQTIDPSPPIDLGFLTTSEVRAVIRP
jgi:hypothetical protein